MIAWLLLQIFISTVFEVTNGNECMTDDQILNNFPNTYKPENEAVKVEYIMNDWNYVTDRNKLEIDAIVELRWKNSGLKFSQSTPCNSKIDVSKQSDEYKKQSWYPTVDIPMHRHGPFKILIDEGGNVSYFQRLTQLILCKPNTQAYPFGNISCSLELNLNGQSENTQFDWNKNSLHSSHFLTQAGSLLLKDVNGSSDGTLLLLTFTFAQSQQYVLIHFFIPSLLFIIPSLLTLLLGPMAITRCCILMTSLILLSLHYSTTTPSFPNLYSVNAVSVWKLFSYVFVTGIIFELVIIILLSSIGRSRCCCSSKHRHGRYEMEPLYEEMNDLRQRKTRKTRNCCRMTALFFDISSFISFAIGLLVFCYAYYFKRDSMVAMINDFNMESLHLF